MIKAAEQKAHSCSEDRLERLVELVGDLSDMAVLENERRRQQDMVAPHPINRPAHRVAD